jgi:hypothetical protein
MAHHISNTRFTYEASHFSCGLTPHVLLMMTTRRKLSIRQISILTALDRDTVIRRLQGLQQPALSPLRGARVLSK